MSNFRLCGDMKKRRWKVLEKRREAETSGARARKGGKIAKDCVCAISGCSRESKSRLAKAAGVEPCAEMRGENVRAVVVRSRGIQEGSRRHKHVTSGGVLGVHWLKTCKALWHELHVREKVGKSQRSLFFQSAGAPEGRKVCSQKRWAQSLLAR